MKRIYALATIAVLFLFITVPTASAHEARGVGDFALDVGWAEEPAVAGFANAVHVSVRHADDDDPVQGARLKVTVTFGEETSEALDLRPVFDSPGVYRASVIPTRAGRYTFHVTGTIGKFKFDQKFVSGEKTFDSPESPAQLEFPESDPSRAELASRADRLDGRLEAAGKKIDDASSKGALATILGIIGILLGLVALVVAFTRKKIA
jgi:hypothetical protein